MKSRTLLLLYIAIAVNLALVLLPTYDASNIRNWIALGSSITSAAPVMANNVWPGGFFSFMAFTPMYLAYTFLGFNLYAAVVVLKLILFVFTLFTGFLLYRITQKIKPVYASFVLLFTLFNPAILYINYFWAQIDILPVFFFTLGYAILRYADFGGSNWKRYLFGFLPILVSAFIYRYPLILLPALILYDSGNLRQRLTGLVIAAGTVGVLFGVEYFLFRGGMYNYVGALSGSVINMSGVEGFQYWVTIPQLPYLLLLGALGFVVPLLFRRLRYYESATLLFILLLFIYTSAVPLSDYFLWLYPIGVLLALTTALRISFKKYLVLTGLPLYVGLFLINFIIGNGVQAGLFYFAYPLLNLDLAFFTTAESYGLFVLVFNVLLLASVVATLLFCLSKSNRAQIVRSITLPNRLWLMQAGVSRKLKAVFAAFLVVLVLLSLGFNNLYSQPIVATNKDVFPLYVFPATSNYDTSPMYSTYYLSWNGLVVFNNGSPPISFYHALSRQNVNLSVHYELQSNQYANHDLFKVDNLTVGVLQEPQISTVNLTAITPTSYNRFTNKTMQVPLFSDQTDVYSFGLGASVTYPLANASSDTYVFAFKFTNQSASQNLNLHFTNPNGTLEYNLSSNGVASLLSHDFATNKSLVTYATYNLAFDGYWNLVIFRLLDTGFITWINNQELSLEGEFFKEDTTVQMRLHYDKVANVSYGGYVTQLYLGSSALDVELKKSYYIVDGYANSTLKVPLNSTNLDLTFLSTSEGAYLRVADSTYTLDSVSRFSFGKLTPGVFGLSLILNSFELSQKGYGYYLVPVYFAMVVPFVVAVLGVLLLRKPIDYCLVR